jgi:aspartate/methionine/tyrosine aminotransferase
MRIQPFKLERYFAEYEFKVKWLLSPSDCESLSLIELLDLAGSESQKLWENLRLGYTESQGHPILRNEISRCYQDIQLNQILVAVPEEAIFVAMNSLLEPGDQVITLAPAYQSLYEVAISLNCDVHKWFLKPGKGGWNLDLNWLEDHLSQNTKMLVINFPHNPTGCLPTEEEFKNIVSLADHYGTIIFCDEMYRGLEYDAALCLPAACDGYERAISISGLSKSYALPGLRIGWLSTKQADWMEEWLKYKDYTTICNSAPAEILAIIAIQNKENIQLRNRQIINHNLNIAKEFFKLHSDDFCWIAPRAGSVAFPSWIGNGTIEQFCKNVLEEQGVMIVPGSIFDFPGSHFRIGLGRLNFVDALGRVGQYLDILNK